MNYPAMAEAPLCGHQQQMIPADHWPLRLIDIASTLASRAGVMFITKNDWDFHVISHTWSLSIREFSKEVGRSLSGHVAGAQDYSDAFARSDFSKQRGYQDLLEFLEILMGDGVKYVWFDALCINQMDEGEKGREIMHMGAYYKYSSGCYVVNHGIGQGYDLLGLDERTGEVCLPRWFTRVWTLQEFLLPTKLIFLVSNLKKYVTLLLNEQIKQYTSGFGLCRCCSSIGVSTFCKCCRSPYWLCQNSKSETENDNSILEILCASRDELCSRCQMPPLIWKAKDCSKGQLIYFVDRLAYKLLITIDLGPSSPLNYPLSGPPPLNYPLSGPSSPLNYPLSVTKHVTTKRWHIQLLRLYNLLTWKCLACSSLGFAHLIQTRICSVDEDRVLSILCLMGLDGRMQVRTNMTLEQQWVEVARELVKEQHLKLQLLNLCIEDTRFSCKVGSSWIPNYRPGQFGCGLTSSVNSQLFLRSARVQAIEVTQDGGLRLEGRAVPAQIFRDPKDQTWQYHTEKYKGCSRCQHFCSAHNHKRVHQRGFCHLEVLNNLCIPLTANVFIESHIVPEEVTSGIIPVHIRSHGCLIQPPAVLKDKEDCPDCAQDMEGAVYLPINCIHFVLPQDVFLVLWGDALKGSSAGIIVMVCVGSIGLGPGQQLHKVGVLQFSSEVANAIFSPDTSTHMMTSQFILGGFGQDVADSWKSSAKKYGVQCEGSCILHDIHIDAIS